MNSLINKINTKHLINALISYFVYFFFASSMFVSNINIFSFLFYIIIFYIINNMQFEFEEKKHKIIISIVCIFLCIMYNIGFFVANNIYNEEVSYIKLFFNIDNIKSIIGSFIYLFIICYFLYKITFKYNFETNKKSEISSIKLFIIVFLILLLSWMPYLLKYYPGIYTSDAVDQLWQATGKKNLINHHPVCHTLFIRMLYNISSIVTKKSSIRILFITLTQMVICSSIYSYGICYFKKNGFGLAVLIGFILYYAFCPIIALYSVTVWKDVIFGSLVLLLCIHLLTLVNNKINKKYWIKLFLLILAITFLRNNAIYMVILLFFSSLFILKNYKKQFIIVNLTAIVIYYIITGPVFTFANIKSGSISESLGIPLQQISRVVVKGGKITNSEKIYIESILPIEEFYESYNPQVVDSIKFNEKYNSEIIRNNLKLFIRNWITIGLKNPKIYVESYLYSTIGYWYPNINGTYLFRESYENEYFESKNYLIKFMDEIIEKIESTDNILFSFTRSIGFLVFVLLLSSILTIMKNGKDFLITLIPIWGLWLTIMIATPVYCDIRYVFYIYTSLPFIICLPLLSGEKKIKKNKKV